MVLGTRLGLGNAAQLQCILTGDITGAIEMPTKGSFGASFLFSLSIAFLACRKLFPFERVQMRIRAKHRPLQHAAVIIGAIPVA